MLSSSPLVQGGAGLFAVRGDASLNYDRDLVGPNGRGFRWTSTDDTSPDQNDDDASSVVSRGVGHVHICIDNELLLREITLMK